MTKIDKRALSSKLAKEFGDDHALTKTAVKVESHIADLSAEVEGLKNCLEQVRRVTRNNGHIQLLIKQLLGPEVKATDPEAE